MQVCNSCSGLDNNFFFNGFMGSIKTSQPQDMVKPHTGLIFYQDCHTYLALVFLLWQDPCPVGLHPCLYRCRVDTYFHSLLLLYLDKNATIRAL